MYYSTRQQRFRSRGSGFRGGRPPGGGRGKFGKIKSFDPSLLVRKAEHQEEEVYTPTHAFTDFALCAPLQDNVAHRGYRTPTQIQDQAIPAILAGQDVIGLAHTGTGKTAAFLLPLITKVWHDREQRVLIVAPTRELAVQIEQELFKFTYGMQMSSVVCIGGVNIRPQMSRLYKRPAFVIGTPGRLRDLEQQGALQFRHFQNIVLDEVDQMVDMGFVRDVEHITAQLPQNRQSLFFSATMPDTLLGITKRFMHDPHVVSVKARDTAASVDQDVVSIKGRNKVDVLVELLAQDDFEKVLVFVRTKRMAEQLHRALEQRGASVAAVHSNKSQRQRQQAIEMFRHRRVQTLLATDVASRGLDIADVTHVINYDLPETYEDYVHRIGRTGRADKRGQALSFVS